ncbi:MAG TPA: hypothetical protein VFJ24_00675 [Gaiellales bacterium]|nr:hypothetical protein [Gaiellales bacterium]
MSCRLTEVIRVRYLVAVMVGLDLGLAAGWLSAPGATLSPEAVPPTTSTSRQDASLPAPPPSSHHDGGRREGGSGAPPNARQLRQQMLQCLYQAPAWRVEHCLQAIVRQAVPTPWLGGPPGQLKQSLRRFVDQSRLED